MRNRGSRRYLRGAEKRWKTLVGLTGGIGSGKSTVLRMFSRKGAFTLDADAIVRDLLDGNGAVRREIRARFGSGSLDRKGRVDRAALAKTVFDRPSERKALEKILHPRVRTAMRRALLKRRGRIAVLDVPLLFESGWPREFDAVVTVWAPEATRRRRLAKRGMAPRDIAARMTAQWPLRKKAAQSDFVIDNGGSLRDTKKNVNNVWTKLSTHQLQGV